MRLELVFAQDGYDVRFDWGPEGVAALGPHCGVLVIVDVLSFTTTVDIVVARGSSVRPTPWSDAHPYALRNATAVATAAAAAARGEAIGVIAAGERWGVHLGGTDGPGTLRPALEDQLGAGAIATLLQAQAVQPSPEALAAARVFRHTDVATAVTNSASGRELTAGGNVDDVDLAVQLNVSTAAPALVDGVLANVR